MVDRFVMPGAIPSRSFKTPWNGPRAGHHETPITLAESESSMIRACKHHLAEVEESYFEHLSAALGFAFTLAKASLACGLHAVIPALCTRTASSSVAELQGKLVMRAAHARSDGDRVRIDT